MSDAHSLYLGLLAPFELSSACRNHDSFRVEFLLLPCLVLSLVINHDFSLMEVPHPTIITMMIIPISMLNVTDSVDVQHLS